MGSILTVSSKNICKLFDKGQYQLNHVNCSCVSKMFIQLIFTLSAALVLGLAPLSEAQAALALHAGATPSSWGGCAPCHGTVPGSNGLASGTLLNTLTGTDLSNTNSVHTIQWYATGGAAANATALSTAITTYVGGLTTMASYTINAANMSAWLASYLSPQLATPPNVRLTAGQTGYSQAIAPGANDYLVSTTTYGGSATGTSAIADLTTTGIGTIKVSSSSGNGVISGTAPNSSTPSSYVVTLSALNTNNTTAGTASTFIIDVNGSQTISIGTIPTINYGTAASFTATGGGSPNGLTISGLTGSCTASWASGSVTVTPTGVGNCSFNLNQAASIPGTAGQSGWDAATPYPVSITIGQGTQALSGSWTTPSINANNATGAISAALNSGLAPTFVSQTPTACTVGATTLFSGSTYQATVTGKAWGTNNCTISADYTGNNANWSNTSNTIKTSFSVTAATQTVTWAATPAPIVAGGSVNLSPTSQGVSGVNPITLTLPVVATPQCSLAGTPGAYTLTGLHSGATNNCALLASVGANTVFGAVTNQALNVTVGPGVQSITQPSPPSLSPSGSGSIATTSTGSANALAYSTPTPSVCSVTTSPAATPGTVTVAAATGGQTCTIHIDKAATADYAAASQVSVDIVIGLFSQTIGTPTITAVHYQPATTTYGTGTISATATNTSSAPVIASPNVLFASGSTSTCSVTDNGNGTATIAGLLAGTSNCVITASVPGVNGSLSPVTSYTLTTISILPTAQTLAFPPTPPTLSVGTSLSTSATSTSAANIATGLASSIIYGTSLNNPICSVSSAGLITATAVGTCVVTADQNGVGSNYSAATQISENVNVTIGSQTLSWVGNPAVGSPAVSYHSHGPIAATSTVTTNPTNSTGLAIAYSSLTPTQCSVDAVSGSVYGIMGGTNNCRIAADQAGSAGYYSPATQITHDLTISQVPQSISMAAVNGLVVGGTVLLSSTTSSGLSVSYNATPTTICTIVGNSTIGYSVKGVLHGACTITASQNGDTNFSAASIATQTIQVGAGGQSINLGTAPSVNVGGTGIVTATTSSNLAVSFSSQSISICTVSSTTVTNNVSSATVTGLAPGTCIIAADVPSTLDFTQANQVTQNIAISYLPPTVTDAHFETPINTVGTFDLTPYIVGLAPTGIGITTQSLHGTITVSKTKVIYKPNTDYFGTDTFKYQAYNPGGVSPNVATVTVSITGRPDPTKDTRVTGIVNTQTAAVKHFGTVQVLNFQQRLESRHHATYTTPAPSTDSMPSAPSEAPIPAVSAPGTPTITVPSMPSGEVSVPGGDSPASTGDASASKGNPATQESTPVPASTTLPGQNFSNFNSWNPNSVYSLTNDPNKLLHAMDSTGNTMQSDPITSLIMNLATGLATSSTLNLGTISSAAGAVKDDSFSKLDIWAAGNLRFGTNTYAGVDTKFATDGVSVGADKRFTRKLTMGMGLGYAVDNSSIGTDGTYSHATGVSFSGYGTYQWDAGTFLDALLGYGKVNFDTNRYVPAMDDFARVARKGDQVFGSLAFGYDYRDEALVLSPYGRYDFSYDRLDPGTEIGAGSYALSYDKQKVKTSSLAIGFRTQSAHQTDFGLVQPHARIEFQHSIETVGDTSVSYADLLGTQYGIAGTTQSMNALVLGVGSDFIFSSSLKLALDYERFNSPGTQNYQAINFRLNKTLDGKNEFEALMDESYTATITKPSGLMVSAGLAYDSNVTRASDSQDIRKDTIYSVSASKAMSFTVSKFTRLKLIGFIDTEEFRTYKGLGHISGGGEGEFMYRTSADFDASTFGIFARFTDDAYESTLRDGTRSSAGLTMRKPLTDRISFFAAVAGNERRANTEVFNTKDVSARTNFDYEISMGQTFYLTGEYRKGDIVSTGQGTLKALDMAEVTTPDDVFTSPQFQDYRMKGKTDLLTLGYNLSLGTKDSLDISWRGVRSTPDYTPAYSTPVSYTDNQYSIAYLMVF